MNAIRKNIVSRIAAFIAGLAFLNMSFFLAEVAWLEIDKGYLVVNIAKLVLNTGLEEERDSEPSGPSLEKDTLIAQQIRIHNASSALISVSVSGDSVNHYKHADHSLDFSQPPELLTA